MPKQNKTETSNKLSQKKASHVLCDAFDVSWFFVLKNFYTETKLQLLIPPFVRISNVAYITYTYNITAIHS